MTQHDGTPTVPTVYPSLQVPEYQCGLYGKWKLEHKANETTERGYYTGLAPEPPGYYLVRDGNIWMSTSRLERESHAIHLKHAQGNVMVCGVGMGVFLYNIAAKDSVARIIAIDLDPAIIDLVQHGTNFDAWPGKDKITFLNKDALKLTPDDLKGLAIDYLYVDIWPELGNAEAIRNTQAIQAVVNAKTVGWWGQEIDFIDWLFGRWPKQQMPVLADLVDFMESIGLPIEEHSTDYLQHCKEAATVFASYGSLPFALAQRKRR